MNKEKLLLRVFIALSFATCAVVAYAAGFKIGCDQGLREPMPPQVWHNPDFISD